MPNIDRIDFIVKKDNLNISQFVLKDLPEILLANQVLFEIEKFSYTSNNVTYAVAGEKMRYWDFFPTQTGYGRIPAWGFAMVVDSNHPEISAGERFYGYFPMSSHLLVTAGNKSNKGFLDVTPHRRELPQIYNFYTNVANDPSILPATEGLISIFRPLFVTSFLIEDHLAEENFYEATQLILTSASSKTAQALAFLLAKRKKELQLQFSIIGLTSEKNREFVESLGCYDQTMSYAAMTDLNAGQETVLIDFTGNHQTQFQLQTHLKENLVYNCLVGLVDWENMRGEQTLPKKGAFFFAPTYAEAKQKAWGMDGFLSKVGLAWDYFLSTIQTVVTLETYRGPDELKELHLAMIQGKINPKKGNLVSLKTNDKPSKS